MILCAALLLALLVQVVMGAAVNEAPVAVEKRAYSSFEQPVPYHVNEKEYAQFVALCQETYCENSYVGMKVGDSKLLYSYGTGDLIQRVKRCCRARTRCTDGPSLGTS